MNEDPLERPKRELKEETIRGFRMKMIGESYIIRKRRGFLYWLPINSVIVSRKRTEELAVKKGAFKRCCRNGNAGKITDNLFHRTIMKAARILGY